MNLYEIALPLATNSGKSTDDARGAFEKAAIALAGGITRMPPVMGAWRDPKTEKVFWDRCQIYRVACYAVTFDLLLLKAFELFPDQITIFSAVIGTATIHERTVA